MTTTQTRDASKKLSVQFELMLPIEDWLLLAKLAEVKGESTLRYILDIIREHLRQKDEVS